MSIPASRQRRPVVGPSLGELTEAYFCASSAAFEARVVGHRLFHAFCVSLGSFAGALRASPDDYWMPLMRHLQRFKFDVSATPVPFAAIGRAAAGRHAAVVAQYAGCEGIYPALASHARKLLDHIREISTLSDAPLLERLRASAEERASSRSAIVIAEPRLVPLVEGELRAVPVLRHLAIITPAQLRAPRCYDRLFVVGPGRAFPDYVAVAPRAVRVTAVHFGWMAGVRRAPAPFPNQRVAGGATHGPDTDDRPELVSETETEASPNDDLPTEDIDWLWYAGSGLSDLARRVSASEETDRHDAIRAIPVALEGDRAVFLDAEDGASVMVIDLEERGKRRVRRVPTADIEEGMFILLRAGGGGDLIVPVADSLMKERAPECRRLQSDWKARLRERIRASSLFEASVALLEHGALRANESNLRRWAWERGIKPDSREDFCAILRLIGLEAETDKYFAAMRLIERAHAKAGQAIRRVLLERVRSSDLGDLERLGAMEFDIPGAHAGRMLAARVLRVGEEPAVINPTYVGRPFERGATWLS